MTPFEEKFGPSRGLEAIACDLLRHVTGQQPTSVGTCLSNAEAALLAINALSSACPACGAELSSACPACGEERWVNIDCGLCTIACELLVWENRGME